MILWDQILIKIYLLFTREQSQKHKSIALDVSLPFLTPLSKSPINTVTSACTFLLLLLSFLDGPHLMTVALVVPLAPSLIFHLLPYLIYPPCCHQSACSEKLFPKKTVTPQLKTIIISATDPASYDILGTLGTHFLIQYSKVSPPHPIDSLFSIFREVR